MRQILAFIAGCMFITVLGILYPYPAQLTPAIQYDPSTMPDDVEPLDEKCPYEKGECIDPDCSNYSIGHYS